MTESGKLYGLGYNKYGQVGLSNSLYLHVEEPIEIFTDGIKIKDISVGSHHTLILDEEGKLYGFGARMNGQIDGVNYDGRQEQCSIVEINLPGDPKIKSIEASSLRS